MIINRILLLVIGLTGIIVIPFQIVTTFVLGILVSITFGLLLIPFSIIWVVLFLGPLLGLSYVYERVVILRPIIVIIGIPLAVIADTYVALLPSMGELDSRYAKMLYCQTFPYTWRFDQFCKHKLRLNNEDVLNKIFQEISKAQPLGKYIDSLKIEYYARHPEWA